MADPKLGKQFRVNTFNIPANPLSDQEIPAIATDAAGKFVITWQSNGQDGDRTGVYAQRYSKKGKRLGREFRVNTTTDELQGNPDVAMDAKGDFVVVWEGEGSDPSRGPGADGDRGIFAQRYSRAGKRLGTEFQINTTIEGAQSDAAVASDAKGNFVVVWGSRVLNTNTYNLYAQRYSAQGVARGSERLIKTVTEGSDARVDVAMDADGKYIVTWATEAGSASINKVFARRYTAKGKPRGKAIFLDRVEDPMSHHPVIDMDTDGNFVVAWHQGGRNILARRFARNGTPLSRKLLVSDSGNYFDVALGEDGDFVVTWQDGGGETLARRFNRKNESRGGKFRVNKTDSFLFDPAVIAMDDTGDYTIAWSGDSKPGNREVFAQRFADTSKSGRGRKIIGTDGRNRLRGGAGNDTITGLGKNDALIGLGGRDRIFGNGGNDKLKGNQGKDSLSGGGGNDTLKGGANKDMLRGGGGADVLVGNGGRDRFVIEKGGKDLIRDFKNKQDRLVLSGSLRFGQLDITDKGNDTLIRTKGTLLARLDGISTARINAADFIKG